MFQQVNNQSENLGPKLQMWSKTQNVTSGLNLKGKLQMWHFLRIKPCQNNPSSNKCLLFKATQENKREECLRSFIHPGLCTVNATISKCPNLLFKNDTKNFFSGFRGYLHFEWPSRKEANKCFCEWGRKIESMVIWPENPSKVLYPR